MEKVIEKYNEWGTLKSILVIVGAILIIVALVFLLEFLVLLLFRKLNDLRNYNEDKLIKKLLKTKRGINSGKHDSENGQMYYECKYWKWQENKFKSIDRACSNRSDLQINYVQGYYLQKKNGKNRRYRKQIRAYYLT